MKKSESYTTYCADVAQQKAVYNATAKGRDLKIGNDYEFIDFVKKMLLEEKYSPYAVLEHIKESHLEFKTSVCKNTLYNYIRLGLIEGVSMQSLPCPRKTQKREKIARRKVSLNNSVCQSIEDRDKAILDRDNYGHWEMDTVVSGRGGKGVLLVFTERMTREEEIYKINSKSMHDVTNCINQIEQAIGLKKFRQRYKTITCDNGVEFLDADGIVSSVHEDAKRTELYYCHPYRSCERGSNENANKLIRRWIPKGVNISIYSCIYRRMLRRILWTGNRNIFNYRVHSICSSEHPDRKCTGKSHQLDYEPDRTCNLSLQWTRRFKSRTCICSLQYAWRIHRCRTCDEKRF